MSQLSPVCVEKMRGGGCQKMSVFVHAQGIKTDHAGGGGSQEMAKFCPRNCWMTPKTEIKTSHKIS